MFATRSIRFTVLLFGCSLAAGLLGQAQVPERSFAGQMLVVPDSQLNQGMAYHVWPGEDTQLAFRSEAPFQKTVLTSNRVIGYILAPFDLEESEKPVLAGAFRIPASSLRSGLGNLDSTLQDAAFLNTQAFPELVFLIMDVEDVEQLEKNETLTEYALQVQGKAFFQGKEHPLNFPARLTFRPYTTFVTRSPGAGDSLILTANFSISLKSFGWTPPRSLNLRVAEEIPVELYLLLNTILPDGSMDPRQDPEIHRKHLRFVTLLRDLSDPVEAYSYGSGLVKEFWENADELHRLTQAVVTTEGIRRRDFGFALRTARRAVEISQEKDGAMLAALARVHYERGDLESAVQWQGKAVARLQETQSRLAGQASQRLASYKSEAEAGKAK